MCVIPVGFTQIGERRVRCTKARQRQKQIHHRRFYRPNVCCILPTSNHQAFSHPSGRPPEFFTSPVFLLPCVEKPPKKRLKNIPFHNKKRHHHDFFLRPAKVTWMPKGGSPSGYNKHFNRIHRGQHAAECYAKQAPYPPWQAPPYPRWPTCLRMLCRMLCRMVMLQKTAPWQAPPKTPWRALPYTTWPTCLLMVC